MCICSVYVNLIYKYLPFSLSGIGKYNNASKIFSYLPFRIDFYYCGPYLNVFIKYDTYIYGTYII